jgi:hypothetical protein
MPSLVTRNPRLTRGETSPVAEPHVLSAEESIADTY